MTTNRIEFTDVVHAIREQTALLLGTTIGFSDEDWATPTQCPGWTRSHIAAHLTVGAVALHQTITRLLNGLAPITDLSSSADRITIEKKALGSGLELQIDLDTSASQLQELLPELETSSLLIPLTPDHHIAAQQIPLTRLREVVIHHWDVGGPGPHALAPEIACEVLRCEVEKFKTPEPTAPRTHLVCSDGFECEIAQIGDATEVSGSAADLLVWLHTSRFT